MKMRRPAVIANTIRLKRSNHKGCFLLVEGRDDRLFFEKFINLVTCKIVVVETKENVVGVIQQLETCSFPGILGVIDADFDRIEGREWGSRNLILLETHDLETLLIRSRALDQVLVEFGSQEKIEKFGRNIRDTLVAAAISIGCLRLHSLRTRLNLKFQGLRYVMFIDAESLSINCHSLAQQVLNRSQRFDLSIEHLEEAIRSHELAGQDPWQICSGDDLVSILALALRKALGTNNSTEVSNEILCKSLRLAYPDDDFARSQLIDDLRGWAHRNPGYEVLVAVQRNAQA